MQLRKRTFYLLNDFKYILELNAGNQKKDNYPDWWVILRLETVGFCVYEPAGPSNPPIKLAQAVDSHDQQNDFTPTCRR